MSAVLERLDHPVVQAPMAGGPSTPGLAIAVCRAGGLGFIAAGYRSTEAVEADLAAVRAAVKAPFGVNLFVPGERSVDEAALRRYADRLGAEAGEPRWDDDGWEAKLSLLRKDPVSVILFTFGCPPGDVAAALQAAGSEIWVTVTNVAEGRAAAAAGADVLVAQGIEAGGHRATWDDTGDDEGLGLLALLRLLKAAVDLPLVATGGIVDGPGLAAVLVAGAAAGQIGTAFLRSPEAATNPAHRTAIIEEAPTAITRAFTGRRARGLRNRFMDDHDSEAPSAYPQVHHATSPLRAGARERGDAGGFNLWAGQSHSLADELPAAEVVRSISSGAARALAVAAAERRVTR
jgi:nitronate monooxygenase